MVSKTPTSTPKGRPPSWLFYWPKFSQHGMCISLSISLSPVVISSVITLYLTFVGTCGSALLRPELRGEMLRCSLSFFKEATGSWTGDFLATVTSDLFKAVTSSVTDSTLWVWVGYKREDILFDTTVPHCSLNISKQNSSPKTNPCGTILCCHIYTNVEQWIVCCNLARDPC